MPGAVVRFRLALVFSFVRLAVSGSCQPCSDREAVKEPAPGPVWSGAPMGCGPGFHGQKSPGTEGHGHGGRRVPVKNHRWGEPARSPGSKPEREPPAGSGLIKCCSREGESLHLGTRDT